MQQYRLKEKTAQHSTPTYPYRAAQTPRTHTVNAAHRRQGRKHVNYAISPFPAEFARRDGRWQAEVDD